MLRVKCWTSGAAGFRLPELGRRVKGLKVGERQEVDKSVRISDAERTRSLSVELLTAETWKQKVDGTGFTGAHVARVGRLLLQGRPGRARPQDAGHEHSHPPTGGIQRDQAPLCLCGSEVADLCVSG